MTTKQEKNDAVLKAVSHPIRRSILRILDQSNNGGVSPKDLSEQMGESVQLISYHVRLLRDSGVVKLVNTAQRRGAVEHFYKRTGNAVDKRAAEMLKLIGKE